MYSTLDELWYGNLCPFEQCTDNNIDIEKLTLLLEKNMNKLSDVLTANQKPIFEKYTDCRNEMQSICEKEIFKFGFKLGCKLTIESFFT
ncbi:MAG: hypothetical protein IIX54_03335 [Clostridia bacterium]|nr:hypothetical protein [Clostridia bacterium]